ncbi:BLUF domain-containing protein [Thalassotalea marina]|uniref:BLUF domain-containing protein n=1 Tax=Thalassotalea marina TaxID=1673741 RepID=A0A919EL08_9GAMM|nr:BLUF domain-containing protein [Thalassotalea marina]GHF93645.1 hypothetical protein GCM10017161_22680 [Thalassotalea marina]
MELVRLVYVSKISDTFNEADIVNILETARSNNHKHGVTGLLCFNRKFFLQCLEGNRNTVNYIYNLILNDNRHQDKVMLYYQPIVQRAFSNWSMGYVPDTALTAEINLMFSDSIEFTPYEMTGESAHQLMLELKEKVNVV